MIIGDAFFGPVFRYCQPYNTTKRFLARWLGSQDLMNSVFVADVVDLADCYSNLIKSVFVGLFYSALVPSAPLITCLACLLTYWVDKHCLARAWSSHSHSLPDKYTALAAPGYLALCVVAHLSNTLSLYKRWPFDNLCVHLHQHSPIVLDDQVWAPAHPPATTHTTHAHTLSDTPTLNHAVKNNSHTRTQTEHTPTHTHTHSHTYTDSTHTHPHPHTHTHTHSHPHPHTHTHSHLHHRSRLTTRFGHTRCAGA